MIREIINFVNDTKHNVGLWCPQAEDTTELAQMVGNMLGDNVGALSVVPGVVKTVWPWLEGHNVKIYARFYVAPGSSLNEGVISELVKNIKIAFKSGATGAQVFVPFKMLGDFVREISGVRDDLFFNKDLIIGLDINNVESFDWATVFSELKNIRADSVLFVLGRDMGNKSDFVGRVYAMLNSWDDKYQGTVSWMLNGNVYRFEQVVRLTQKIRPDLLTRTVLFGHDTD